MLILKLIRLSALGLLTLLRIKVMLGGEWLFFCHPFGRICNCTASSIIIFNTPTNQAIHIPNFPHCALNYALKGQPPSDVGTALGN